MDGKTKNIAASVHQRLLNKSRESSRPFNKTKLGDAPASFENVIAGIKVFLQPVVASITDQQTFRLFWTASGPWST